MGGIIGNNGSNLGNVEKSVCSCVYSDRESVREKGLEGALGGGRREAAAARSRSTNRSFMRRDMESKCRGWVRRVRRWSSLDRVGRRGADTYIQGPSAYVGRKLKDLGDIQCQSLYQAVQPYSPA